MILGYSINWPLLLFLCFLILAPVMLNLYLMNTSSFVAFGLFFFVMVCLWNYYKEAYY